jgi:putative flippase GtrA
MPVLNALIAGSGASQVLRFGVNGVVATAVHYSVLVLGFGILRIPSAGLVDLVAACCGITVSFFGSRIFVFQNVDEGLLQQAARFGAFSASSALFHTGLITLWTDICRLDYNIGFLIATALQAVLNYFGNKYLVFSR